jgi:hypothetical protein
MAGLRARRPESRLAARVVELAVVDVGHGADGTAATLGAMSTDAADIDLGSLRDQLKLLADYL